MLTVSGVQESGEAQTFTSFIYSPQSAQGNPECVLELYTLPSDAAHEIMPTRPLATSRGKDENIEVTKAWLEECQSHHAFCRRNEDTLTQLPARLIEISDDETAQLVETSDQVGRYVALSYCWGENPEENRITTVQNIQMRLLAGSLPRDELPGAIRDGLAVAEQLGIKYIWVDAFCIIQDDQDDKNEELSKMGQYYKNSYLTIAASTPRCTTGFIDTIGRCEKHPKNLLPRDLVPLHVFCIAQDKDEGHSGRVYAREENPYQLSMEPLNRRAWALQESLLSPRVLFFGSRTIWFCRHMTHSDGGIEDWSFEENELERTRREFQIELSKLDKSGSDDQLSTTTESGADGSRGMYNMWHRIVGTYSQRSMSRPEDKLPAISAVAAEFARLSKDEYLAGLWRSNLARDLLWTTPDPATHRPETWRAPTWSWASIDDPILYEKPPPADAILLAKIEEVGTTPRTMTVPFGEVARGSLRMTAPCFNQDLGKVDDDARDKTSRMWLDGFKWKGGKTERAMLLEALRKHARGGIDKKEDGDGEDKTYRLPDLVTVVALYGVPDQIDGAGAGGDPLTEVKHWRVWGLILKPVDAPGGKVYERVISFSRMPLRFTDPAKAFDERRTIDII
ncbi:HET-domain-containing protein [Hypoxylon sp. FL1284]|nr:HET-domain-containing protein [Hypoxylon sp. FL1284]